MNTIVKFGAVYVAAIFLATLLVWGVSFMVTGEPKMSEDGIMALVLVYISITIVLSGVFSKQMRDERVDSKIDQISRMVASDHDGIRDAGRYQATMFQKEYDNIIRKETEGVRHYEETNRLGEEIDRAKAAREHIDKSGKIAAKNVKRMGKAENEVMTGRAKVIEKVGKAQNKVLKGRAAIDQSMAESTTFREDGFVTRDPDMIGRKSVSFLDDDQTLTNLHAFKQIEQEDTEVKRLNSMNEYDEES